MLKIADKVGKSAFSWFKRNIVKKQEQLTYPFFLYALKLLTRLGEIIISSVFFWNSFKYNLVKWQVHKIADKVGEKKH